VTKSSGTGTATLQLRAHNHITVSSPLTATSGKLNTLLWADTDSTLGGRVALNDGTSIQTNGGGIWIGGVHLNGTTDIIINAGTGNVFLQGASTATGGAYMRGIHLKNTQVTGADMVMIGSGSPGNGSNANHWGVNLNTGTNITASGQVTITGTGGGNATTGGLHHGVLITDTTISTTSGAITITGTGGNSTGNGNNGVILNDNTSIHSITGDITITGTGGGRGGSVNNDGFSISTSGGSVYSTGGGALTVTGARGIGANAEGFALGLAAGGTATLGHATQTGNITVLASNFYFGPNGTNQVLGSGAVSFTPLNAGTSFTTTSDFSNLALSNSLTDLTIGHAANTGSITLGRATSIAGPIAVYGENIAINAPLTATGTNTVTLRGTGTITDGTGGYLVADRLALLGGAVTLDHASNNVGTLAASGVGALTYINSTALTIGSVGATSGVNATGPVRIETLSGDLMVAGNLATTDTSSSALTLNAGKTTAAGTATGGNLLISGAPSVTVGSGGQAILYSGSVSAGLASLIGSGSGRFRYNSDESAQNYTAALSTGLYGIYREQPTATVTADDKTITYSDALTLTTTLGGVNGDTIAQAFSTAPTVTVGGSTSSSNHLTAGSHSLTVSGGTGQLGYAIGSYVNGTLTVNQKAATVSGLTAANKVYDGTTSATVDHSGVSFGGLVAGDLATASGTSGTFATKGVGTGKTVTLSGTTYGGADAGNYTFTDQTSATADITAKALTYTGTAASLTHAASGIVAGDAVTVNGPGTGAFADKTVGTSKIVAVSGIALSGADSGNYSLGSTASTTADITAKTLTIDLQGQGSRVYDGGTAITLSGVTPTLTGVLGGDAVTVASGNVTGFVDKNVGINKAVTYTGFGLSGADATNYVLASGSAPSTATITAKAATVSRLTAANKVYDSTISATVDHSGASFSGLVAGDLVTASGTSGSFATKAVGTGKTVTLNGTTYGGADAGNYAFTNQTSTTADITTKALTIDLQGQGGRVYDGGTAITLSGVTPTLTGVLGGDAVTVASGNVTGFVDKNVGINKAVTYTGFGLSGADATNYVLASGSAPSTATITAKAATVSGLTAHDKYYDGTTAATINHAGAVFAGMITGDHLVASGTVGTFADPTVERGKAVALQGTIYGGVDAGNYTFTDQTSTTASILDLSTAPAIQDPLRTPVGGTTELSRGLRLVWGSPSTMSSQSPSLVSATSVPMRTPTLPEWTHLSSPAVVMKWIRERSTDQTRVVRVLIPQSLQRRGEMITFGLPEDLREALTAMPDQFTQTNGSLLPKWLEYDPVAKQFRITDSTAVDSRPYPVLGTVKGGQILMTIELQD